VPTRILATAEVPAIGRRLLEPLGTLTVSAGDLEQEVRDAHILLVRAERVTASVLDAGPRLQVIARTGAGVDNVDIGAATARGIPVINAPAAGTTPVAEGTWALILAAAKRLGELRACIDEDRWPERYAIDLLDLRGATLGVVGLGSIGQQVARLGRAFGMTILATDVRPASPAVFDFAVELTGLDDMIRRCDVLTLHCDLNDTTRGVVNRRLLQRATRRPILVNAARGAIVDGDVLLVEALEQGWLSAVALDVFASEPVPSDSPLLAHPRVICTPHSIGLTQAWNNEVFGALAADIRAVLARREPRNLVNREALESVGYRTAP
jgi:D-3-phosphoglycerate dehydrogenase